MKRVSTCGAVGAVIVATLFGPLVALRADDSPPGTVVLDNPALLQDWTAPAYPEEARKAKKEGVVEIDLIVDEHGAVTEAQIADATDPVFEAVALEAVRRWKFEPARDAGKPVASGMITSVVFSLAKPKNKDRIDFPPQEQWPTPSKRVPARVISAPDPDYPSELEERRLPGQVELEVDIDASGRVVSRRVIWASHGAFVSEALRAAGHWKFEPARQGLLAIPATKRSPVAFMSVGARPKVICEANGLKIADGAIDVWPEPIVMAEPVYPRERLLAGEEGTAIANFTIDEHGRVAEFTPGECSAPEFGEALAAAVDAWLFRPAFKDGSGVPARATLRHEFRLPDGGPIARLAAALRSGSIASARGLDAPLEIMWRGLPVYPAALHDANPAGDAQIEFIVDRDGRARLPHVVSATRPEFGWAAATAVSQWVFAPPRRGGGPTEVRVRVPLRFSAKE